MKALFIVLAFAVVMIPVLASAHGGGCRKTSPPGQCCHLETKTGLVHCH